MEGSVDKVDGIKHIVSVHKFNGTIAYALFALKLALTTEQIITA